MKSRALDLSMHLLWYLEWKSDKCELEVSKPAIAAAVAQAALRCAAVAHWRFLWLVGGVGGVGAQRSPLGWAMGSSQRLAAVAAVSHSRHYYNHTQSGVAQTEAPHYTVNIFFVLNFDEQMKLDQVQRANNRNLRLIYFFIILDCLMVGVIKVRSDLGAQVRGSATLCGVLVAVCAACWRRSPATDKPEEAPDCRGVYTVSADATLVQATAYGMDFAPMRYKRIAQAN
ncbi:unnamed protein product [Diatraea saccharalis]|uniref:Uncharacterized protein n=1 Tax=Diatraea saccharalis TaxID=40085 RepID=A0A9N9WJT4_9NEOP|nr:unnamed protein product [Diatraea saccharalis]